MKNTLILSLISTALLSVLNAQDLAVQDDFEGNGTITSWIGDECSINPSLSNPFPNSTNPSATVLEYHDTGGQYANVRFEINQPFPLDEAHTFALKIYVPASGLTGNSPNQVSLKLQDGSLPAPWSTQCEIIKSIQTNQWVTLTFDFENDTYTNLDPTSLPPTQRTDFNRVVIQVNGENNNDQVLAYLDDVEYDGTLPAPKVYGNLVWSDEFDADGAVDGTKWFHQTQLPDGNSWFNGEIQHYTNRIENSVVENGILKIIARNESFTDQGVTKQFTSARLNSKFTFTYGKVEVRAKLPSGSGTWPAIWTLGKNITETGAYWQTQGFGTTPWPQCGEMDIMEHWGTNQNHVSSATHTPSSFGGTINTGGQTIPTVSTAFHVYEMEWTPEKLVFSVDGNVHFVYEPQVKNADTWPFDSEQYILFNLAILPSISPSFTNGALEIDYIRIYQEGSATSIEEGLSLPLKLSPNPVQDQLRIKLPSDTQPQTSTIRIYSLDGSLIREDSVSIINRDVTINDLSGLSIGVYLVEVGVGDKLYSSKFVKQ